MKPCLTITVAVLLMASVVQAHSESISEKWKKVDACGVTFQVPNEAQLLKRWGIDSCVKVFRSKDIYIVLDITIGYTENDVNNFRTENAAKLNSIYLEL